MVNAGFAALIEGWARQVYRIRCESSSPAGSRCQLQTGHEDGTNETRAHRHWNSHYRETWLGKMHVAGRWPPSVEGQDS